MLKTPMPDTINAKNFATQIVDAFNKYNDDFKLITQKARERFENRDWISNQEDAAERIDLYDDSVNRTAYFCKRDLGERKFDKELWADIRDEYARQIAKFPDSEFFKTFFSSITRRVFTTIGVDPQVEFIALDIEHNSATAGNAILRTYRNRGELRYLFDELLADYELTAPYRDIETTIRFVSAEVDAFCSANMGHASVKQISMLEAIFYRGTRACLVGRIEGDGWSTPMVIALKNMDEGIMADAVLLSLNDVSTFFGFTRSYFHADIESVGATVNFLKSLMPRKSIAELYTVLGRAKQGKTERFRSLIRHLENSTDQFIIAQGDKGMVMEVFTLPSYDLVFKIIRDRFAFPKSISRRGVMEKYELVFRRDRAGRLVDAQEFRRLQFNKDRFSEELMTALLTECADTCRLEGDYVIIEHLYMERRLRPLNLYLREMPAEESRLAAIDYGQSIRDLANSNIFAGDLLLKNFGVTRQGRVIFYDYDELCLVTECNFRRLPEPRDEFEEMSSDAWFYVGPNDIFPEQFVNFLGFPDEAKAAFMEYHSEILDSDYWNDLKRRLASGEVIDVLPYAPRLWTTHHGGGIYPAGVRELQEESD